MVLLSKSYRHEHGWNQIKCLFFSFFLLVYSTGGTFSKLFLFLSPSGFVELSFVSPPSPNSVPDHPQDLCTPQLRQLLTSIFSPVMPPASSSSPASSLDSDSVKIRVLKSLKIFWRWTFKFKLDLSLYLCLSFRAPVRRRWWTRVRWRRSLPLGQKIVKRKERNWR